MAKAATVAGIMAAMKPIIERASLMAETAPELRREIKAAVAEPPTIERDMIDYANVA
jgi:hypothetical protein